MYILGKCQEVLIYGSLVEPQSRLFSFYVPLLSLLTLKEPDPEDYFLETYIYPRPRLKMRRLFLTTHYINTKEKITHYNRTKSYIQYDNQVSSNLSNISMEALSASYWRLQMPENLCFSSSLSPKMIWTSMDLVMF